MINFRYHIVSLAAVLFALAAGIVIGANYLQGDGTVGTDAGGRTDEGVVAFERAYADRTATPLLRNSLRGGDVLIITMPGARATEVTDIATNIRKAGGSVSGEVAWTAKLLDAGSRQFAESVAEQAGGPAELDGYARVGATLAPALLGEGGERRATVRAAFEEGGLIDVTDVPGAASAVVIVAGPGAGDSGRGDVAAELAAQFAEVANAVVVAGPSPASADGGVLEEVRNHSAAGAFSTVDVTDTAAGRVVTVLALSKTANGDAGSWGTNRSDDGALP